ncbi:hypothetical protein QIY50_01670 [Pseudomonas putida]|nr:hypothetical protein QIY50_01670 [Pseudomonas putida]
MQQQFDHIADIAAGAAVLLGDTHGVKPGCRKLGNGLMGQLAFALALRGTFADGGQQGHDAGLQLRNAGGRSQGWETLKCGHGSVL